MPEVSLGALAPLCRCSTAPATNNRGRGCSQTLKMMQLGDSKTRDVVWRASASLVRVRCAIMPSWPHVNFGALAALPVNFLTHLWSAFTFPAASRREMPAAGGPRVQGLVATLVCTLAIAGELQ